jgi:hypothetical protein
MTSDRRFCIALTVALMLIGLYLLSDSFREDAQFADVSLLVGATLTAAGVATGSVALQAAQTLAGTRSAHGLASVAVKLNFLPSL